MIDSLCIVGGGTSGLISALMMAHAWPDVKIKVIESSQIGIIGVGEGTTEHWKRFIDHVGISVSELVRETDATFKMGIKFTNWHGDGTHYFHSLSEQYAGISKNNGLFHTWIRMVGENVHPLDTAWKLAQESRHVEPLHEILAQYHFDTNKLNDFFHKKARERGVEFVDTEITDVILDDQGYIKQLVDKEGRIHHSDFYIDSSGFRRVLSSKLGTEWVDCTDKLPMNSAMAFPTARTEDIPSYTEATALSSGWVWRIPTQERYGNGYVFCDSFIDETKAYDEVSQHYKDNLGIVEPLNIGKRIKFGAGYVKEFWIKNCVAIGLSGIFVEPLEASSIGTTITQCFLLTPALFYFNKGETQTAKGYNNTMSTVATNIVDFIQLHYFTQRDDTEFWRWCKNEIKITDFNKQCLDYFKESSPNPHYFNHALIMFNHLNYMQVMHGLRMFNTEKIGDAYNRQLSRYREDSIEAVKRATEVNVPTFSHRESLNILKERYTDIKYEF